MNEPAPAVRGWQHPQVVAALAALVVLAIAVASITGDPIGVFVDDGIYTLVARALASGAGYHYAFLPGSPPAIHYPPVFPLVLAALMKVTPEFPANVAALKLVNPACYALGVYGAVRFGVRALGLAAVPAAIAVALCALIAPALMLTNVLMSEPLFFATLVWSLLAVEDAAASGGARRAFVAGTLCALVTLVRTVGGVVVPAAVLALWSRHRRREAALLAAVALVLLAPWQLWVWSESRSFSPELHGMYGPYLTWLVGAYRHDPALVWQVVVTNAATLWRTLGYFFAPRLPHAVQALASVACLVACALGLIAVARRAVSLAVFLLLYGGIVLVWPYAPARFVGAVWPLAGLVLVAAARAVPGLAGSRALISSRATTLLVTLLLAGHAVYAARGLGRGWAGTAQRGMTGILWPQVEWAAAHVGTRDVVASDAHVMIALYTGRTTIPVSMLTPAEYLTPKPVQLIARELGALYARYHPTVLTVVRDAPELGAIPLFAALSGAPIVIPLPPIPGGGSAFLLRRRHE